MSFLFAPPYMTVFDTDGNPVSGAKLYFYQTGTTTPVSIYSDADLTTPLANPVVADSAGRHAPVYLDSAVTYRCKVTDTANNTIKDVDPITSNLLSNQQTYVTPETYGATGDGVADDTTALTSAIASGYDVFLPLGKSYKFTADLTISTNYQRFGGPGVLVPVGSFGIIVGGGCTGVEVDLTFNSSGHTGTALKVDNANRVRIKKLHGVDVNNALYVRKANSVTLEWAWAICRGYGITWYGDNSNRSDIFTIINATFSVTGGDYGLDWDGNCHSLEIKHLGIVCGSSVSAGNGYGAVIRNTSGGAAPAIGRFDHIEIDYSGTHAIDIQAGSDYDIAVPYLLGATGSGVKVGASINDRQVRVGGGKSNGHTRYGIETAGGVVLLAGNTEMASNTLGQTLGDVRTESPRYHIDANGYWTLIGGNPYFVYDSTGYTAYDRSGLAIIDSIGGNILVRDANRITAYKPLKLASYTVGTLPSGQEGDQAIVTDANATTYMSAVAGGGANTVRVTYLGGGWKIA